MKRIVFVIALCVSMSALVVAQQRAGSLRGQVLDELGGAIVGASVTVTDGKGVEKSVVTNDSGTYTINGLTPGKYTVRAINAGFAMSETPDVEVVSGKAPMIAAEFRARDSVRGEITIVIGAAARVAGTHSEADVVAEFERLRDSGMRRNDAVKAVAEKFGLRKNDVYRLLLGSQPQR